MEERRFFPHSTLCATAAAISVVRHRRRRRRRSTECWLTAEAAARKAKKRVELSLALSACVGWQADWLDVSRMCLLAAV